MTLCTCLYSFREKPGHTSRERCVLDKAVMINLDINIFLLQQTPFQTFLASLCWPANPTNLSNYVEQNVTAQEYA